jgi:hypothetical protein
LHKCIIICNFENICSCNFQTRWQRGTGVAKGRGKRHGGSKWWVAKRHRGTEYWVECWVGPKRSIRESRQPFYEFSSGVRRTSGYKEQQKRETAAHQQIYTPRPEGFRRDLSKERQAKRSVILPSGWLFRTGCYSRAGWLFRVVVF